MGPKEAFVEEHEAQLSLWDTQIQHLEAVADNARAEPWIPYFKHLRSLHIQRMTVHESLREVKLANEDKWESLKTIMETDWQDLRGGLLTITATFQ